MQWFGFADLEWRMACYRWLKVVYPISLKAFYLSLVAIIAGTLMLSDNKHLVTDRGPHAV